MLLISDCYVVRSWLRHQLGAPGTSWPQCWLDMRRPPSAKTGTAGVTQVRLAIEALGWLFREQPGEDYGIDAQAEIVEDNVVEGKLLALQIKSGASYFKEPAAGGWWYRPGADHVRYWFNHSLPVAIILVDQSQHCYWQLVTTQTLLQSSREGWKVLVPSDQVLDESARSRLHQAAEGDPYLLRVRALALDRPWMKRLADGERVVLDIEEWINKSSGRGSISLGIDNEDGKDPTALANWSVLLGLRPYEDALPKLFPWADLSLHEATYDNADHQQYEVECSIYDEGDRLFTEHFDDWMKSRRLSDLRPYANEMGEIDLWRLQLTLNDLGQAFLIVDEFVSQDRPLLLTGQ